MRDAFKAMPVKSDRNDARGDRAADAAGLVPAGALQVDRRAGDAGDADGAQAGAIEAADVENSLRGILRGFGLKVGETTQRSFAARIRELVAGHAPLETIAKALLAVHAVSAARVQGFREAGSQMARSRCARRRLLMSTPGVGPIVALTYASAIDDPARFKSSKRVGAHFGLTPKKYQSGADRLHRPDQQDRRRDGAHGAL